MITDLPTKRRPYLSAVTLTNVSQSFTYKMAARLNWHIYETKSGHRHRMYRRVKNIGISAHFTHLLKFRNFVFATELTIFSGHNPLVYLRECAPKSAKLTRWALGLQEFMHSGSNMFHTCVL